MMSLRSWPTRPLTGRYRKAAVSGLAALGTALVTTGLLNDRAHAHHSFAATYHEDQRITIEGTVLQFQFRNPHTFIHVQAPDENGEMHRWAVEWSSPAQLSGQGVDRSTLRPGDLVRVTGAPGRDPEDHRLVMRHVIRPTDGFEWGNNPNERVD